MSGAVAWEGITQTTSLYVDENEEINLLSKYASEGKWEEWFGIVIDQEYGPRTRLVNSWWIRDPQDKTPLTYYTALHHAASRDDTSVQIVERLLQCGAWRQLPTADGKTAFDIATEKGNNHLLQALAPVIKIPVPPHILANLQKAFEEIFESSVSPDLMKQERYRFPLLRVLTEFDDPSFEWRLLGGSFSCKIQRNMTLVVTNHARFVTGAAAKHVVEPSGKWTCVGREMDPHFESSLEWPVIKSRKKRPKCVLL